MLYGLWTCAKHHIYLIKCAIFVPFSTHTCSRQSSQVIVESLRSQVETHVTDFWICDGGNDRICAWIIAWIQPLVWTNGLIMIHGLFSIATDVIPLLFSAHTQSFHHINRGSPVCVLFCVLSKTRWGNDILKVSVNKDKGRKNSSKRGECFPGVLKWPVHYFGDYNQQSHSAILWALGPLY